LINLPSLETNGFVVVPDLLSPEVVAELIEALDAIRPGAAALEREGRVYASRNLLGEVPRIRELAAEPSTHALVSSVLGANAFAVRGLLFDKTAEANWTVPWHQDLSIAVRSRVEVAGYGRWTVKAGVTHVQPPSSILGRMLTVRFQLDPGQAENGPLRVIPGSHRHGRLDAKATRNWLEHTPAVACLVPVGGALVMKPLLLHASSPSVEVHSGSHRRVIHLEFAADALPEGLEWHDRVVPTREVFVPRDS
jgi:ectoine hydroxylase-related dioxygenase (phytanoyl-CoA dioxygenase family)